MKFKETHIKKTSCCNELSQTLKYPEDFEDESKKEFKKLLDCKYNRVKSILDKDFYEHFSIVKETNSRILELDVAYQLISYGDNTSIQVSNGSPKKDIGGPDFKIVCENYNIFIECVCAQDSNEDCVEPECEINKIEGYPDNMYSQIGSDKRKVSRISSVISDKSKKINKYKKSKIISDNDIVVLVIGTNFKKTLNWFFSEFEDTIAYKSICEHEDRTSDSTTLYDITLEDNCRGKFKKDCKDIKVKESELDSFDVFIYADTFNKKPDKNKVFYYKPYVRKLPDEYSKETIEKIFDTKAIEFNRYLYRKDGHERCSKEAILRHIEASR